MRRLIRRAGGNPNDALLAVVLWLAFCVELATATNLDGPIAANGAIGALLFLPLVWRRSRPVSATCAGFAAAVAFSAFLTGVPGLATAIFPLVILTYSLAGYAPREHALAGLLAIAAGTAAVDVASHHTSLDDWLFPAGVFGIAWAIGRIARSRAALSRELRARTEQLERERREHEREAIAEERARIARELHDVVAHSVSVMVVQAGAARRVLDRDPERSIEALGAVEVTGREALAEMRRLLGILRPLHASAEHQPVPSLRGLGGLVDRFRAAGLEVALDVDGEPGTLPPGVDLCAYRVVQEALTNAIKHSGSGRARVAVRWDDDGVTLEVVNRRAHPAGSLGAVSGGHGLIGMRERVALCGGELEAGAADHDRFVVCARLPRRTEPVAESTSLTARSPERRAPPV